MYQKIIDELDRRIKIQLKIMSGLNDEMHRYGFMKAMDAYQQSKMIVEELTEPKLSKEIVKKIKDYDSIIILCPECNWNINQGDKYCRHCGQALKM